MSAKIRVMCRAFKIRLDRGELLEDILASYPRLTGKEKQQILDALKLS